MADSKPEPPKRNPALRMLGLPALPKKLPSRNWLIFWTLSTAISAGIIYDRREKRRATARWAAAVKHLASEPLPSPSAMPRKLTVFLFAPPGDGLRPAQDHFAEYVKPILAASGVDWEFVVGRREGDVRAVIAERVRRGRRKAGEEEIEGGQEDAQTAEDAIEVLRRRNGIAEYEGIKGDIVIGRNTWKEYVRGVHEGWLGPLTAPKEPEAITAAPVPDRIADENTPDTAHDAEAAEKPKEPEPEPEKPKAPSQPTPYILPAEYPTRALPLLTPAELTPSTEISFPHILGFLSTPTRMRRFFGRRYVADDIGRDVAAACFAAYREYSPGKGDVDCEGGEVEVALKSAEADWVKTVWKEEEPPKDSGEVKEAEGSPQTAVVKSERLWASPLVVDPRIATRMRRFEVLPDDELKARQIVVPEEEVEGWVKGHLRQAWRWGVRQIKGENKPTRKFGDSEADD